MKLVELTGIQKSFPKGLFTKSIVLNNIDFDVHQGDFIVLRGANGAGKSTLIKLILGLQKPDRGSVKLFGESPQSPIARQLLGTVFQEVTPPNSLRVKELVSLVRSYYPNSQSTSEILEAVGLSDKRNTFPSELSGGQKQRLYFALALVGNPKLLILDEPTKNLDVEGQEAFWGQVEACKQQGVTILMVTHIKSEQDQLHDFATHIITLADGALTYDKRPETSETAESEEATLAPPTTVGNFGIFLAQTWAEILQIARTPIYLLGVLLLSSLSYFVSQAGDSIPIQQSLVFFSAFCLLIFSIDRLGKRISIERVEGWLKLLRVTPLPPGIYIAAKLAVTLMILALSLATIFGIGVFKLGLEQTGIEWFNIIAGLLLGIIPFTMLGIALGYVVPPKALDSITGLLIPVALVASGQMPLGGPEYLQDAVVLSPFFHYAELIKSVAQFEAVEHLSLHILWLMLYAVIAGVIAKRAYQRNAVI
jgi:ABC-2 type transport system ATP-binding protein